jgi:SpoVK/Ycf46/Vps4 family AAA+-type ATPase
MSVLKAIGGSRVFFIASMNDVDSLPPELRARFSQGTWYFDVPDDAARRNIFAMNAKKYGVELDGYDAKELTGRDIRDLVRRQYELGCSTVEASRYHVPLCKSAPDAIAKSRQQAEGRYLCAAKGGPYSTYAASYSVDSKPTGRAIQK